MMHARTIAVGIMTRAIAEPTDSALLLARIPTAQQKGVFRPMAGAAQPGVEFVHPVEVALIALGEALDYRDRGPVDRADHAHVGEQ